MDILDGVVLVIFVGTAVGAAACVAVFVSRLLFKNIFLIVAFQAFYLKILLTILINKHVNNGFLNSSTQTLDVFKPVKTHTLDLIFMADKVFGVIAVIAVTLGLITTAYRMYKKHEFTIKQTLRKFRR